MEGFFYVSYAAMEGPAAGWLPLGELVEPRQWRRRPEPRNGGGAKAWSVELAKEQNGRTEKITVQKISKISNKFQKNLKKAFFLPNLNLHVKMFL